VTFWVFGAQGIVVASQSPLELTVEGAAHFFEGASALGLDPAHAGELFERALATQLLSESDVTKMASDPAVTINTDRNRRLEFASARHAMDAADVATRNVVALARGAAFRPLDVTPDYPPEARALVERADAKRIRALASSSR
jgi:hypothetical protein